MDRADLLTGRCFSHRPESLYVKVMAIDACAGELACCAGGATMTGSAIIDVRKKNIGAGFGIGRGVAVFTLAYTVPAMIEARLWHPVFSQLYRSYLPPRSLFIVLSCVNLVAVKTQAVFENLGSCCFRLDRSECNRLRLLFLCHRSAWPPAFACLLLILCRACQELVAVVLLESTHDRICITMR
jgi:hypothetical protein